MEIANGPGAGAGEVVSGGQGLTGLRERARLVGGMVHAGATEDGGFRVAGVLPYGAEPAGVVDVADDFGQQAQALAAAAAGAPMDWAAVDRELVVRGRGRAGGVALGCGIAFAALVVLVIVIGAGAAMLVGSVSKAMMSREEYDRIQVGESEQAVRDRLPHGESFLTEGLDRQGPERPKGSQCVALLSREDSEMSSDAVFRFCFKDGKLVDKQSYEVKS